MRIVARPWASCTTLARSFRITSLSPIIEASATPAGNA
jgi:hypothetical protein